MATNLVNILTLWVGMGITGIVAATVPQGVPKSCDWTATGADALVYNSFDLNGDGFDDLVCLNKAGQIWAALNVNGWKSAGWNMVREPGTDTIFDMFGHCESGKLAANELALVFADRIEIVIGAEGKMQVRHAERLPEGARFAAGDNCAKATGEPEDWPPNVVEMLPPRLGRASASANTRLTVAATARSAKR